MDGEVSKFIYGAIGGGLVAIAWSTLEKYWVGVRLSEAVDAKKKLRFYAKPLWLESHFLQERLEYIVKRSGELSISEVNPWNSLTLSPKGARSMEWFTKEGQLIISTAYMLAAVFCWIRLFQRDVVFLNFGKKSSTAAFFQIIEKLKHELSDGSRILWYHYLNGIGEYLIDGGRESPVTVAEFSRRLLQDELFRDYYDQLFQFFHQVGSGKHMDVLRSAIGSLREIKAFLETNGAVPKKLSPSSVPGGLVIPK